MRPMRRLAPSVVLFLLMLAPALSAQTGTVRGRVADSAGTTLSGASITVEGTGLRTTSGGGGSYEIRNVPAGTRTLRARLIGYSAVSAAVTVPEGGVAEHDFTLTRTPVQLAPIDVVVGSRARHTAAEELAVPVDIYTAEDIRRQGTTETSQILQSVSQSVNFPRQTVTDANDIVRPFTMRGLSPDHTLVLLNGWRRHQMAVVNIFAYGMGSGSSGVDLNTIPSSAIERIEVLRDGASAQYGSDAIAGVVNIVTREGQFNPFVNATFGRYLPDEFPDDGTTLNVNGGWGFRLGRGSLAIFGEFLNREPTNRAFADPFETSITGQTDSIGENGEVIEKRNPVEQPNHHWGDGLEKDVLSMANFRMPVNAAGTAEIYAFGGFSYREGTGNGYRRYGAQPTDPDPDVTETDNWPQIYPLGFLPEFNPEVRDWSAAGGFRTAIAGWSFDIGAAYGVNDFEYNLRNTLNVSLGPCLDPQNPCAPGLDGVLGTADDPGIPNQTRFFAGGVKRDELSAGVNIARGIEVGLPEPLNLAFGASFRREEFEIEQGETASWINGGHPDQLGDVAVSGSQVFPGFEPADVTEEDRTNFGLYGDAEAGVTGQLRINGAARFERYSDFGERVDGKLALRFQPRREIVFRGAISTGFRAPGISQIHFRKVATNFLSDPAGGPPTPIQVGYFPVDDPAARALGAVDLKEETSLNISAGFAVTPVDNLTFTADYYRVEIDDRIILSGLLNDAVVVGILTAAGFPEVGGAQFFTNAIDTRTQGFDITANIIRPAGNGTIELLGGLNYNHTEILREDPLPPPIAAADEPGLLDVVNRVAIEEEHPDWRGSLQGNYSIGRFRALGRFSYYGGFASAQPGFCDECREEYGGKGLVDAEVGWRFDAATVSLGMRNIFDTFPDIASETNSFGYFPWAAASPFGFNGRQIYVRTEVQLNP
ncbi:MAG: TonB-dependent receptor [Gemmatimonadales bacterium]